uniref:AMP-dependent synthetase/ligase domain-containing protein n=1 Tax=Photinus pyralis TaxID=7054 RepID=A0A1Y1KZT7_PHOPY
MQATEKDKESGTMSRKSGLSYLHNPGSEPLRYMTLFNLLESAAARYGPTEAFVSLFDNRKVTYTELHRDADQLASGFRRLGLVRGDRIGLWAPNGIEWVTTMYAAARGGLITVDTFCNLRSICTKF